MKREMKVVAVLGWAVAGVAVSASRWSAVPGRRPATVRAMTVHDFDGVGPEPRAADCDAGIRPRPGVVVRRAGVAAAGRDVQRSATGALQPRSGRARPHGAGAVRGGVVCSRPGNGGRDGHPLERVGLEHRARAGGHRQGDVHARSGRRGARGGRFVRDDREHRRQPASTSRPRRAGRGRHDVGIDHVRGRRWLRSDADGSGPGLPAAVFRGRLHLGVGRARAKRIALVERTSWAEVGGGISDSSSGTPYVGH